MKKFTCLLLFLSFLFLGSVNAQTGVRFGLKAGYSLATSIWYHSCRQYLYG